MKEPKRPLDLDKMPDNQWEFYFAKLNITYWAFWIKQLWMRLPNMMYLFYASFSSEAIPRPLGRSKVLESHWASSLFHKTWDFGLYEFSNSEQSWQNFICIFNANFSSEVPQGRPGLMQLTLAVCGLELPNQELVSAFYQDLLFAIITKCANVFSRMQAPPTRQPVSMIP